MLTYEMEELLDLQKFLTQKQNKIKQKAPTSKLYLEIGTVTKFSGSLLRLG